MSGVIRDEGVLNSGVRWGGVGGGVMISVGARGVRGEGESSMMGSSLIRVSGSNLGGGAESSISGSGVAEGVGGGGLDVGILVGGSGKFGVGSRGGGDFEHFDVGVGGGGG